jgi:hypothetical protein
VSLVKLCDSHIACFLAIDKVLPFFCASPDH